VSGFAVEEWEGGLDASPERSADFLANYWQRRPVVFRGAFGRRSNPLSGSELVELACEEECDSRVVTHAAAPKRKKGDKTTPKRSDEWALQHGPFQPTVFADLALQPSTNWTLLVNGVERLEPAVAETLDRFRCLPAWRVDDVMVSYAPPGGGVGAHVDSYDVFLVQGSGSKLWEIEAKCVTCRCRRPRDAPPLPLTPPPSGTCPPPKKPRAWSKTRTCACSRTRRSSRRTRGSSKRGTCCT